MATWVQVVIVSLLFIDIILRIKGNRKMDAINTALGLLSTAITNLSTRVSGTITPAQAAQVASAITSAATQLDAILPAQQ